ncbi:MAG TPA: threonylcarbamoyl-AMP synthase [Flavobacteriales bacterium]|jgi:tRNA threonylcarbamoyl adenosine modification protein (Sua5/YciO/YrdC/YwlC family)|nr:threonylcarbamoyl-AMP synthase [Flavobacteriales bacterium]
MLVRIHPDNPQPEALKSVVEILRGGGVIIYPTDTVYGIGCDITNKKAVERVAKIKGLKPEKANLSIICYDLSHITDYAKLGDNRTFKIMKRCLPGPFTFILTASSKMPKIFMAKKKTIGLRIPDHNIPRELVRLLGNPIVTTSIRDEDDIIEYSTDPELIHEKFEFIVDCVIDGGYGNQIPSTIVNCADGGTEIVREGLGDLSLLD